MKVLMDFRTATERARQTSAAVQQWLDAQGKGGDPYKLMEQVVRQRVEMTTQLIKDVTVDFESLETPPAFLHSTRPCASLPSV